MLANYFKIALRNISKNKLYSGINILGLAIGFAVCILIALYVNNEWSYDKWVPQKEQVYRVYRQFGVDHGGTAWTPPLLAPTLKADFPEVQTAGALSEYGRGLFDFNNDKRYVENIALVDSNFFQIVQVPYLHGSGLEAMNHTNGVILTKALSEQMFGAMNPIGQIIQFNDEMDLSIAAVIDDLPGNSHLFYDAYVLFPADWNSSNWTGNNRATYLKIKPHTEIAALEDKITTHVNGFIEKQFIAEKIPYNQENLPIWQLQSLEDLHLNSLGFSHLGATVGNPVFIKVFIWVAFILLFLAAVNYINLSTALASQRAKEVGVRKATGATKTQLVTQFLVETVAKSLVAGVFAILLAELLLPAFNTISNRELSFLGGNATWLILPILGLAFLMGILSGVYPAFVLSSFEPVKVLKTGLVKLAGGHHFRKALVTSQFVVSITLIIVIVFIFRQISFMQQQDLGFNSEQVIVIPSGVETTYSKVEALENEFLSINGVKSITTSSGVPGQRLPDWGMMKEGSDESLIGDVLFVGESFAETMGLTMKEGRFLSYDFTADSVDNFVVNETFLKEYNIEEPVIGTKVKFTYRESYGQIVGVVKDFHYQSLNVPIKPLVMNARPRRWYTSIKISTQDIPATINTLKQKWSKIEPGLPMDYSFLDEDFGMQYAENQRFATTMLYATILTIFIACLGLFGLATFSAQKRRKEIGIRKVLGASVGSVVGLLSKDFLILVLIAFIVASPFAWMASNQWLSDFAYRIDMDWWVFGVAGFMALFIAFLTIAFQGVRAAIANPIDSLKTE